jgi:hypothetical protein
MLKLMTRLMVVSIFVGVLSVETSAKSRGGTNHVGGCGAYMYRNGGKCVDARNKSGKPFAEDMLSKHWKP